MHSVLEAILYTKISRVRKTLYFETAQIPSLSNSVISYYDFPEKLNFTKEITLNYS